MKQSLKDFLRKYKDMTEKMDKLIGSMSGRVELTEDEKKLITEINTDLKSLSYYAAKHDKELQS